MCRALSFLYPSPCSGKEAELLQATDSASLSRGIPKTGWKIRENLVQAYRHFREAWVDCNVFKSPGPIQFGDGGCVGPMSDRPFTLLAEYLSLDELKAMIQPKLDLPRPVPIKLNPPFNRDVRVVENLSLLERKRLEYKSALPQYLRRATRIEEDPITPQVCDSNEELLKVFPLTHTQRSAVRIVPVTEHSSEIGAARSDATTLRALRVGIVFASSQVPGFHCVVAGLFDYLATLNPPAKVIGFLSGYDGLIRDLTVPIDKNMVDQYRNLGGQDMICQFGDPVSLGCKDYLTAVTKTIARKQLDGLVLVGNLYAQVDAALIAEACAAERLVCKVIGVPVSLDCDFPFVQQTIGHDTICRTLSSYLGGIGCCAQNSGDTWVFVRIVGTAWSHIAVQCALLAHPNTVLLSGHERHGQCLANVVNLLCDLIVKRAGAGHKYGVVLIPTGFATGITELRLLHEEITEIKKSAAYEIGWDGIPDIEARLKPSTAAIFDIMPRDVQYEMCFGGQERQADTVDLSTVSIDRVLLRFVEIELQRRMKLGLIADDTFRGTCHPMMYQGRSALPTDFDCDLGYTLGWGAGVLVRHGKTSQLVHASSLQRKVDEWCVRGIPLTCLLDATSDGEHDEARIFPSSLALLNQRHIARPFTKLPPQEKRITVYHGPVQYFGDAARDPSLRTTWHMENMPLQDPTELLQDIFDLCGELHSTMALASNESTMYTVNGLLSNGLSVLESYKQLCDSKKGPKSAGDPTKPSGVWRVKCAK